MRGPRRLAAVVGGWGLVLLLVGGCEQQSVDSGVFVLDEDGRAEQVRRARAALATPVPRVVAELGAFESVVDEVWTADGDAAARAANVAAVDPSALLAAADALEEVELVGDGPDVRAARLAIEGIVAAARAAAAAGPAELVDLPALAEVDPQLLALAEEWDVPGSFSRQVTRLAELEERARALAAALDRAPALPCTGVWTRRVEAATLVADRTAELRDHVLRRDGDAFDAARAVFRADPLATDGRPLGELDAAAASCWRLESAVPDGVAAVDEQVAALTDALDPADLRAPQG